MGRSNSQRKNNRGKRSSIAHRAFPLNLNQAVISLNKSHLLGERERQLDLSVQFSGPVRINDEQGRGLAAGTYADWQLAVPDLTPGLYAQFIQSVSPSSRRRVRADGVVAMREELEWFSQQRVFPLQQPAEADLGSLPNFNAGFLQNAGGLGAGAAQSQDFQMPPPPYVSNSFNDHQALQAPMAPQDIGAFPQQNPVNSNGARAGAALPAELPVYQDHIFPEIYDDTFISEAIRNCTPPTQDGLIGGAQQSAHVDEYQGNMNAQSFFGHYADSQFSDAAFGTSGSASPSDGQSDMAISTPSHNGHVPSVSMSSSSFQQEYVPPVGDDFEKTLADLLSGHSMLMDPQRYPSPVYDPIPGPSRIPFDHKVSNWIGEVPMSTCSEPVTPPVSTPVSSSGSLLSEVWSANFSTDFESSLGGSFSLSRATSPATSEDAVRGFLSAPSEADVSLGSPSPLPIREDASAIGSYRDIDEDSAAGMTPASFAIYETGLEKDLNPEVFAAIENDRTPSPCPPSPQYEPFTMDSFHF